MPSRPIDTFGYVLWPVNDCIVLCQMGLLKKKNDQQICIEVCNSIMAFCWEKWIWAFPCPQRTSFLFFSKVIENKKIQTVIIIWSIHNDGIEPRASRQSLKNKMTAYLQPHSQPAQAWLYSAWCACTGKWLQEERETEWNMKRAIELVRWAVWLCNYKIQKEVSPVDRALLF